MSRACLEAGGADGLDDEVQRLPVVRQVGREAALVPEAGRQAALLEHRLQRVVDLRAPLQGLAEGRRADRRHHELLDVDAGVGVGATVEDVHHRHRQQVGVGTADVAEQRQLGRLGRGPRDRQRDAEQRVGSEPGLRGRAVQVDQRLVDQPLLAGLEADQGRSDLVQHAEDGLLDTLAAVALLVAVPQLDGLELAGAGAAGHGGAGDGAVVQRHLHLDSGVAARVEDLAGSDGVDARHGGAPSC